MSLLPVFIIGWCHTTPTIRKVIVSALELAPIIQSADVYISFITLHISLQIVICPNFFVYCQVLVIVCLYKFTKYLVLRISCNVTFLTKLIEGLWKWKLNSARYRHMIGKCIPFLKFRNKNAGCCSCAATQERTCCMAAGLCGTGCSGKFTELEICRDKSYLIILLKIKL